MCTVTFWPRADGYLLAMNRDEQRSRVPGLPPTLVQGGSRPVLQPSEPGGGTWVTLNDAGVAFTLINWYSVPSRPRASPESRGRVVLAIREVAGSAAAGATMESGDWTRTRPFRLIGFFPRERIVSEWRWNQDRLAVRDHVWCPAQWVSSGLDEPGAQRVRSAVFESAMTLPGAGSVAWLRRLHAGHEPDRGAYSICMHRDDAVTVSSTEIEVAGPSGVMRYRDGSPCCDTSWSTLRLALVPGRAGA